jgi:hypothetical protein
MIQLFDFTTSKKLSENQGWANNTDVINYSTSTGDFPLLTGSLDAAMVSSLSAGTYTVIASDTQNLGGAILAEAYDGNNGTAAQRITCLSARGYAYGTDKSLTAGFVISGSVPQRVVLRGVGPNMTFSGVATAATDTKLIVYNSKQQAIAVNDNWETQVTLTAGLSQADASELAATFPKVGLANLKAGSKDAAILLTLPPGLYTLQVSGVNGASGDAMAEVYLVP